MNIKIEDDYLSPNEPILDRDTDFTILATDNSVNVLGYLEPNTLIMAVSDIVEKTYKSLVDVIDKFNEDEDNINDEDYNEIIKPEFEEYLVGIMINAFSRRHGLEEADDKIQINMVNGNNIEKVNLDVLNYFKQSIIYNLNKILDGEG